MMKTFDYFNIYYYALVIMILILFFRDFADFYLSVITHTVLVKIFD